MKDVGGGGGESKEVAGEEGSERCVEEACVRGVRGWKSGVLWRFAQARRGVRGRGGVVWRGLERGKGERRKSGAGRVKARDMCAAGGDGADAIADDDRGKGETVGTGKCGNGGRYGRCGSRC